MEDPDSPMKPGKSISIEELTTQLIPSDPKSNEFALISIDSFLYCNYNRYKLIDANKTHINNKLLSAYKALLFIDGELMRIYTELMSGYKDQMSGYKELISIDS
jgi:hypothetical protein